VRNRKWLSAGILTAISLLFSVLLSARTEPLAPANNLSLNHLNWSSLKYSASKLFISVDTHIKATLLNKKQAELQLKNTNKKSDIILQPSSSTVLRLDMDSAFLGQRSKISIWFNSDGSALQRTSQKSGHGLRYRRFRYTPDGAWSIKRHPKPDEQNKPWQQWSNIDIDRYHIKAAKGNKLKLTEAEALFYFASVIPFNKIGNHFTTFIFSDNAVIKLEMKAEQRQKLTVNFIQKSGKSSTRIDKKINVMKVRIIASSYPPGSSKSKFSLLGYKGDIDLYIDLKRHVIVQLSGKADYLGKVSFHLNEVIFRGYHAPQRDSLPKKVDYGSQDTSP